ncbi:uncharacterized protein RHOBADRAFT_46255 [Rhodotorula graminis WP1]|uniref:Uncharacterized protein n=1 Tax=Rhodotorula graminis (strain WP1) TaxID=578459 RepID=A0A0P9EMT1_RHOGW|nr:uncharacterized protein RHOBADRAFT_46255 [Rhodotorula graminis WP1]KPV73150.1 hypothetical protein RHOBADRAFT_46255 [Rhodotorula graminis WP1]
MADAAPGQPATLLQRLAHTDPVFARLLTVYSSLTPAVISQRDSVGRSDSNNVANIRAAPERFARGWADLLPDERERAVDLVVSSFCDLEARSARDWTMLPYRELQGKAKRSRILHHHDVAKKELKNLQLKVDEIVSAAPSAASFRTSFSSPDGVTAAKLKRMQKRPVDLILAGATDAAQSPEDRLDIFTRCVGDLLKLYHDQRLPHVSHGQHHAYLDVARDTLLSRSEATSFLEHLPPDRQRNATRLARNCLYSACSARMSGTELPLLRDLISDLCSAVIVDIDPSTIRPPLLPRSDLPAGPGLATNSSPFHGADPTAPQF